MNKVVLMGRLVRDAEVRYTQGPEQKAFARLTLAVDRHVARNADGNQVTADFISCAAFGKRAEFLEKFGKKGMKFVISGRLQTGSYTDRDGRKVYTTDVILEEIEFAESKGSAETKGTETRQQAMPEVDENGFMHIPDGIDEELPFA